MCDNMEPPTASHRDRANTEILVDGSLLSLMESINRFSYVPGHRRRRKVRSASCQIEDLDHDENYQANAMHCRRIVRELEPTELINKVVFSSSCEERVKSYLQEYELQWSQAKHGFSARVCSIRDLGEKM